MHSKTLLWAKKTEIVGLTWPVGHSLDTPGLEHVSMQVHLTFCTRDKIPELIQYLVGNVVLFLPYTSLICQLSLLRFAN